MATFATARLNDFVGDFFPQNVHRPGEYSFSPGTLGMTSFSNGK
ncbi:MAG: hypothetical protein SFX18_13135 [Pirellulales bacterium]|nr:hypothetical protein [Pirellulales bacterium]